MHKAASVERRIEAFSVLSGIAGEQHYASRVHASDGPHEPAPRQRRREKAKRNTERKRERETERDKAFFLS